MVEFLVAIGDGEIAQAATADVARHRRHVKNADEQERIGENQRRQRFRNQHGTYDGRFRGAHGTGRLDDAWINWDEILFDQTRRSDRAHDDHRENRRDCADGCAHHLDGQRLHGRKEDDEWNRANDIHDHIQDAVEYRVFE